MPLRAASAASAKANFASGSQKRLMSQADAMRSMCGRGRVTQVLPCAGKDVRWRPPVARPRPHIDRDRKSTRLNSSHLVISYAVFCLKKKKTLRDSTDFVTLYDLSSVHKKHRI